jgi:hypothetical protein
MTGHGRRARSAPRWAALALALLAFLALPIAGAGATSVDYPFGPDFRHCGPVRGGDSFAIHVSAKKLACPRAKRVVREFYFGTERRKRHHGPENYNGWWTLKRFPGWRCTEGTGGGGCRKRGHEAAFSTL